MTKRNVPALLAWMVAVAGPIIREQKEMRDALGIVDEDADRVYELFFKSIESEGRESP